MEINTAPTLPTTQPSPDELLSALNAPSDPSKLKNGMQQLGQEDFLRLLTTQLQNQDPTDPLDPKDMITDLTGFNQLEATLKLNKSMAEVVQGFANLQTMQAATLIGKHVKVQAESLEHVAGQPEQIKLDIATPLKDAKLVISDGSGVVKEMDLGTVNAGEQVINWDGTDSLGQNVPAGPYKVIAYGEDENGEIQSIATILPTRVTSVAIQDGGTLKLTLATGEVVDMNNVREISQ
ncbi:flagellar basal-body rod modification protein FlgD [Sulfurivirga caldicuralii]|uniref:Basal-body rod modification protein FlgD n=1 Tax=Sulfurivirga caldicuralii TaxID=364032 RepID=A0A1N6E5G2_9GAMM|nr:flagellar hook capping FlgD N-terminal domain-containing protein [Sulfurivirga caldicuralii]SIN78295.1 flagellar basal-body rod modification protein FlgD [Sulfurivirga caldicuralii]